MNLFFLMLLLAPRPIQVSVSPVGAEGGIPKLAVELHAQGAPPQKAVTDAEGRAHFPQAPEASAYQLQVFHEGIRFPFSVQNLPPEGLIEVQVPHVSDSLEHLELDHRLIQIYAEEEGLVVYQELLLRNTGSAAVLPGEALILPCPEGAKDLSTETQADPRFQLQSKQLTWRSPLLPGRVEPIKIRYRLPYKAKSLEWSQRFPIKQRGATIVTPKDRSLSLRLDTHEGLGTLDNHDDRWSILRIGEKPLAPGEALRFTLRGLPTDQREGLWIALFLALLGALSLFFALKAPSRSAAPSLQRLQAEKMRLLKALQRLRAVRKKGRLSEARYQRESEALRARLASLYRILDAQEKA